MSTHTTAISVEDRALALLGDGHPQEQVAQACGVSPSRISQLMGDPDFAARVSELRFTKLSKHNARDDSLDALEDTLISKLSKSIEMLYKPMEITRVLSQVNAMKRRGASAPETAHAASQIVSLTVPVSVINKFVLSGNNQVVETIAPEGRQSLVTIQSGKMDSLVAAKTAASDTKLIEHKNEANSSPPIATISQAD